MKSLYAKYEGRGKDSLLHRNLRLCTEEGVFATPYVILSVPGNFFLATLITQVLGVGEGAYGILVSLPAWFNALQVFYVPYMARYFSSRVLTIGTGVLNILFWILLIFALPRIEQLGAESGARWLFLFFVFISVSQSVVGVTWMSWIQEWIPSRLRGKYFGRRNAIMGFATVGFILLGGWILDYFGATVFGFQILLGIVGLLRLMSLYLQSHIYTPWSGPERVIHEGWWDRYASLGKHPMYFRYLVFAGFLAFWLSFLGPFVPVYLTEHLDVPMRMLATLMLVANIAAACTMPIWGRISDKHGCKVAIAWGILLWMTSNYLWLAITPDNLWVLYALWIWGGFASGGVILGGFNLLLKMAPREAKSAGISVHLMATSVCAAFAPILAGLCLEHAHRFGLESLSIYRFYFVLQPTAVLLSLLLLARVTEPTADGMNSMMGALRTFRQIFIQNGLMVVANLTSIRSRKK